MAPPECQGWDTEPGVCLTALFKPRHPKERAPSPQPPAEPVCG